MTTATAIAHPNIALVKYWGKRDIGLNLPAVSSLSLTLDGFSTRTTVSWGADHDSLELDGEPITGKEAQRVFRFLDRIDGGRPGCAVRSTNDFPRGAGLASSASGFAALALAASAAAGHDLEPTRLSRLARQGSGSACRSLWGGYVRWDRGVDPQGVDSVGVPVANAEHWDLRMVVAVVSHARKKVGSTEGMERSRTTSPYYDAWVNTAEADVVEAEAAVRTRDLQRLGTVMEQSTLKMHAAMHTAWPPLIYWQPGTVAALHAVHTLRDEGISAWATMDAGPQVKVLCTPQDAPRVAEVLSDHAEAVHVLGPGGPAHLIDAP